jgi:ATP-dependent RNA helicase RhlE
VHRIGRTGRAAETGDALMLATPEEANDVAAIEKFIGKKIPHLTLADFPYEGGGQPPRIDTANPSANSPRRAGQQRLGAGGQRKGEPGRNQSKESSRPFGGGNPNWHSKGKPGAHWRNRKSR